MIGSSQSDEGCTGLLMSLMSSVYISALAFVFISCVDFVVFCQLNKIKIKINKNLSKPKARAPMYTDDIRDITGPVRPHRLIIANHERSLCLKIFAIPYTCYIFGC